MHRLIKVRIIRDWEHLEEQVRRSLDHMLEAQRSQSWFRPAADFYETPQGLVLRLELAGVAGEDVSLTLAGQELVVRGRRRRHPAPGIRRFWRHEISLGTFERRFKLPMAVDAAGVEAHLADGILEVLLPRKAPQTRHIPVNVSPSSE